MIAELKQKRIARGSTLYASASDEEADGFSAERDDATRRQREYERLQGGTETDGDA